MIFLKDNVMAIQTINPATGEVIETYDLMSLSELDSTINKTHNAYLSWKSTSFSQRSEKMLKMAQVLRDKAQECALVITNEMGKPLSQSLAEVEKCAWLCEHYAESAEGYLEDRRPSSNCNPYVVAQKLVETICQ